MTKSKNLGLNLPSRDNTTDLADINVISENFETIDNEFENVYNKLNNSGVVNTVSGNSIVLKDSANAPLKNLKLFGKTTQNGTPTPDAPVPLVSVGDSGGFEVGVYGKDLLPIPLDVGFTSTNRGITYTVNEDKSISVSGTPTDTTNWKNLDLGSYPKFSLPIGTYKFVCEGMKNSNNLYPLLYSRNTGSSVAVQSLKGDSVKKITITEENKDKLYLVIGCIPTYTPQGERLYISIFPESVTDLSYEPYNKQTLTMPYTLRGVGEVKDEVDFARGMRTPRFAEVDLGTLNWAEANNGKQMSSGSILGQVLRPINNDTNAIVLCSSYRVDNANNIWNGKNDKSIGINTSGTVVVCDSNYTNATEFKNAMSGVILQYALATPQETPLTEQELNAYRQLHTNKPNTTIISEADMEVSYVADTKLYIDNKLAELTALTLEG